jgi:hypothetical protein
MSQLPDFRLTDIHGEMQAQTDLLSKIHWQLRAILIWLLLASIIICGLLTYVFWQVQQTIEALT